MKSPIVWDITLCKPVKVKPIFRRNISSPCACCLLHVGFLLGLCFDIESGDIYICFSVIFKNAYNNFKFLAFVLRVKDVSHNLIC
jgi:hypothetical protein